MMLWCHKIITWSVALYWMDEPRRFQEKKILVPCPSVTGSNGKDFSWCSWKQTLRERPMDGVKMKAYNQLGLRSCYQGSLAAARRLV